MLPEEHALPCAEAEPPVDEGDDFHRAGQRHLNVARHVIRPLVGMRKVGIILRDEAIDEALQISASRWIGVFHNHQTATGMAAKDGDRALAQAGLAQALFDGRGELFGRFPGAETCSCLVKVCMGGAAKLKSKS